MTILKFPCFMGQLFFYTCDSHITSPASITRANGYQNQGGTQVLLVFAW